MTAEQARGGKRLGARALAYTRKWLRGAVMDNAALKLVALILSITLFIVVNTGEDRTISAYIRVSYAVPDDQVLVSEQVDQVRISVRGSWRRVKHFDEREVDPIQVDLRDVRSGSRYVISEDAIRLPPGLELQSIEPASIPVVFEDKVDNTVPVRVPTRGTPSRGYTLAGVVPEPAEVTIRGPESAIAEIASVRTTEVRLDGQEQSFTTAVTPLSPHEKVSIVDAEPIIVTAEITEEIATRPLGTLAVEIRAGSGLSAPIKDRFAVQPREVTVVAHGPLLKVEGLGASLTASVKVYGEDVTGRARDAVVEIDGVPEGVGIEVTPREVKVHLRK